jgi:hypothetical protein
VRTVHKINTHRQYIVFCYLNNNDIKRLVMCDLSLLLPLQNDLSETTLRGGRIRGIQMITFSIRVLTYINMNSQNYCSVVFCLEKGQQYTYCRRICVTTCRKQLDSIYKETHWIGFWNCSDSVTRYFLLFDLLHRAPKKTTHNAVTTTEA